MAREGEHKGTREGKGEKEQEWECIEKVREGKREGRGRRR